MNTVFTLGYTGSSPADVRDYVQRLGATLVDVRFRASSRVSYWNGPRLAANVGPERYVHVPELGNRNYRGDGAIDLADPRAGLVKVLPHLERGNVILLCACADHNECHRSVAAELICRETGAPFENLPARIARWRGNGAMP